MKKKLLFIMPNLHAGGAEKVLIDLLSLLDPGKYDIDLVLLFNTGELRDRVPAYVRVSSVIDREYFTINQQRLFHHFPRLRSLYLGYRIKRLLRKRRFDTIISFLEGNPLSAHSFITSRAAKNVSWVHTDLENNHYTARMFRDTAHESRCYGKMDEIVLVSQMALGAFERVFPELAGIKKSIIYNPIPVDAIRSLADADPVGKKRFTIAIVGRLVPVKRHDRFIEVVSELKSRGLDFDAWIVGDGETRPQIEEKISQAGVSDRVTMWGYQSNPYRFIKAADLLVLTSDAEGYSLVVAESQILGTPVVSTRVTGPVEILADGSGLLVDPDPVKIADEVERMIKDPDRLKEYVGLSLESSRHKFDVGQAMKRIEDVF